MEFHLDRSLKLVTDTKHKSLYAWAINEVDDSGNVIGDDQIPWDWSLYFTSNEILLSDNIEINEGYNNYATEIKYQRFIRANLRPGSSTSRNRHDINPTYRMFGTNRVIEEFCLQIEPLATDDEIEACSAWGSVSYTSEVDFRYETDADCIWFYLKVKPSTFERYAGRIAAGTADEIILSVGSVAGFYSSWSPSIRTSEIKVLASGEEQKLQVPADLKREPPRLGTIGKARLSVNAKRTPPAKPSRKVDDEVLNDKYQVPPIAPEAKPEIAMNRQLRESASSLQRGIYWIIILLSIIAASMVLK